MGRAAQRQLGRCAHRGTGRAAVPAWFPLVVLTFLAGLVLHVGATDELSQQAATATASEVVLETGGDGDGMPDPICTAAHRSLHDGLVGGSASTDRPDTIGPAMVESETTRSPAERTTARLRAESLFTPPLRLSELCISRT